MPDKWYLNLRDVYPDGKRKSRSGTLIRLAAKPSVAVRYSTAPRVNWTVDYTGSPDANVDYVVAPNFTPTQSGLDNGYFRTTLELPVVNGRTYTIEARRTGNNARVFQKQYETWQRIYYTVHYMNNTCRDVFNAAMADVVRLFATANIELKQRKTLQCRKDGRNLDEEFTVPPGMPPDVTLPHAWDDADAPLDRAPNHIRFVVTRELSDEINGSVQWTMDRTTTATPARKIRVSSTGPNNSRIIYENDIATFDRTQPFTELKVYATFDPIDLPGTAVALADPARPHRSLQFDFAGDDALAPMLAIYNAGVDVTISGTLRGRRCEQGWQVPYSHETRATLSTAHTAETPLTVRSAKLWITGGNTIVIDDPRMVLDAIAAADTVRVHYAEAEVALDGGTITRTNDHRLTIALAGNEGIVARLGGGGTIDLSLNRRGALANGDEILAPADYAFKFKNLQKFIWGVLHHGEVNISARPGSTIVDLGAEKLAIAGTAALTARFVHVSIPVRVPTTVITTTSSHHAEIDLRGHDRLGAMATAMHQGRTLTFTGNFNGRESVCGYSPRTQRWFIGLGTRPQPGWDADVIRRRLKITICHEIGHSLGLVRDHVQNRRTNTRENNDRWHQDDHGGTGSHCHHNAHRVPSGAAHGYPTTESGEIYRWNPESGGKLCIMYHSLDHANIGDVFCDRCLAHLRRGTCNFGTPA